MILPWGLESRRFLVLAFSCSCPAALWDRPGPDHGRHTDSILCQGSADPPPVLLSQNQEAIGLTGRVDFTRFCGMPKKFDHLTVKNWE